MHPQRTLRRRRLKTSPVMAQLNPSPADPPGLVAAPKTSWQRPTIMALPIPVRTVLDSFRSHLDALYAMALLYNGEHRHAEEAVVNAACAASADLLVTAGDPSLGNP